VVTERGSGRRLDEGNALACLNELFPDPMGNVLDGITELYSAINSEAERKGIGCIAAMARCVRQHEAAGV